MTNLSHFSFSDGPEKASADISSLSISLPDDWKPEKGGDRQIIWFHTSGDALTQSFFPHAPDFPCPAEDLDALRAHYRDKLQKFRGGLVEVESQDVGGLPAVRTIFKFEKEDSPLSYIAGFTWGLRDICYSLKVECHLTGENRREQELAKKFADDGLIDPMTREGWRQDPYDYAVETGVISNLGEDEQFDEQYADHPLSRARRHLVDLAPRAAFSDDLKSAPPFTGPAA